MRYVGLVPAAVVLIAFLVAGVLLFRKREIEATENKVVTGWPVRVIAGLVLLAAPLACVSYRIVPDLVKVPGFKRDTIVEIVAFCLPLIICPLLAAIVGFATAKPTAESLKGPAEFRVPCSCGQSIVVTEASAGASLTCSCGRSILVPPLRRLRQAVLEDDTHRSLPASHERTA
jgi:hypothetical protein